MPVELRAFEIRHLPIRRAFSKGRPMSGIARLLCAALLAVPLAVGNTGTATATESSGGSGETFIPNQIALDRAGRSITLPLLQGTHDGQPVSYVVTDSSDRDDAERRGVIWAPKLVNALDTAGVQRAAPGADGRLAFEGTVDFSPTRSLTPDAEPNPFPPVAATAGAVGDAEYSPLTQVGRVLLNATQVANASGLHDAVRSIDVAAGTVTLDLLSGFYNGKKVLYLHQEASVEVVAAAEGSTYVPRLDAVPGAGSDDKDTSARSAIIPIVNGARSGDPQVQGLDAALAGEVASPDNITQSSPGSNRYSPIWDITPGVWTDVAIAAGERVRVTGSGQFEGLVDEGLITSFGSGPINSGLGGIRSLGGISNCPVVFEE